MKQIHLSRILVRSIAACGLVGLAITALLVWSWQRSLDKVLRALVVAHESSGEQETCAHAVEEPSNGR